ncbi:MAG: hypothetical protein RI967_1463 [Planctomycetota bacterium]
MRSEEVRTAVPVRGEFVETAGGGHADGEAAWCLRWLAQPGVGAATVRRLVARFGTLSRAAHASVEAISDAIGGDRGRVESLLQRLHGDACLRDAVEEMARTTAEGAVHRVFGGLDYPELLAASADPPALLAVRGVLAAAPEATVAIVGSRRATTYGRLAAGRIAAQLAERGIVIVSGGARGIDAEAHRGAIRAGGRTIAVMATGLGHAYPPEHRGLYDEIVSAGGAVLTEQPHAIEARPELFPRRNRIVAGLSIVTVVIEAAARSGALLTARLAVEDDGRDVGCLPGPVDQPQSEGCHRAIREGWAHLVTGADDIVALLEAGRSLVAGAIERSERSRAGAAADACVASRSAGRGRDSPEPRLDGTPPCVASSDSERSASSEPARRPLVWDPARPSSSGARLRGARDRVQASAASGSIAGGTTVSADRPDEDELHILEMLSREPLGMDGLEAALDWTVPRIASVLLRAEMAGRVERTAGGAYARAERGKRPA